jgi:hypothetical protein
MCRLLGRVKSVSFLSNVSGLPNFEHSNAAETRSTRRRKKNSIRLQHFQNWPRLAGVCLLARAGYPLNYL